LAPLDAIQPTSVISKQYIENNIPLTGNYDSVISIAPSVSEVSPNGPGLMENQFSSIRGFQDGQYNVTFDGIPWGDSNDFTHHTTSFFMSHDIKDATIDRGPGTGSTIGYATFGGTVAITSVDPSPTFKTSLYGGYGSFNTVLGGVQLDTGAMSAANGSSGFIDVEGMRSSGYLTNQGMNRQNVFAKLVVPVTDTAQLTFVSLYNVLHQNVSLGATKAQIAQHGPNFGLSADPTSQAYYGFNYDYITTDLQYVGLTAELPLGISLDNKLYTLGYYHKGYNGQDPNGESPNGVSGTGDALLGANNVPGQVLRTDWRSYGDVLRLKKDFAFGDIQAGVWVDHKLDYRKLANVDMTANQTIVPANNILNAYDHLQHDTLDTVEPYVQIDIKPITGLTISPGIKYNYIHRDMTAVVNQSDLPGGHNTATYTQASPSLVANYQWSPHFSTYAQVAQGFKAPGLNVLYTTNTSLTNVNPETSWNYQGGAVYRDDRLTASADLYYIDFTNYIGHRNIGGIVQFYNLPGVIYKGAEAEATYYVGRGVSLYGNASVNSAVNKQTKQRIADAPDSTAAFGVIYNKNGIYASLIEKWVGSQYGDTPKLQGIDPYGVLSASLAYTHKQGEGIAWLPAGTFRVVADNLLDTHAISQQSGYTYGAGTPLFWTVPGRTVFVTASIDF